MKSNLFIKYRGLGKNDSEIDLATLGESIIGFDIAIKEIFKISKITYGKFGDMHLKILLLDSQVFYHYSSPHICKTNHGEYSYKTPQADIKHKLLGNFLRSE